MRGLHKLRKTAVSRALNLPRAVRRSSHPRRVPHLPFHDRCHEQAARKDNLSSLRGIGDEAIRRYARRGILTLNSRTPFDPGGAETALLRLSPNETRIACARDSRSNNLDAWRTKHSDAAVRNYIDMKGDAERGFIYLIGLLIHDGEHFSRLSPWPDHERKEATFSLGSST